jgi:hypothetical protein
MLPTILGLLALASSTPSSSFVTSAPTPDHTGSKDDWVWVVVTVGMSLSMVCCYCCMYVYGKRQLEQQGNIQEPLLQERGPRAVLTASPPAPGFVLAPVPVAKKRKSRDQGASESPSQ